VETHAGGSGLGKEGEHAFWTDKIIKEREKATKKLLKGITETISSR